MTGSMIRFYQPSELIFGNYCFREFANLFAEMNYNRVFILADAWVKESLSPLLENLDDSKTKYQINTEVKTEPSVSFFNSLRAFVESQEFDAVIGVGGGSVMDTAKLIAALSYSEQSVDDVFGIDKLSKRKLFLACIPTTSGTGSEVSPNAILLDENENLKKGVVSKHLVPDIACVDPVMTWTVPPGVTAGTGIDALTHCLEAYANKFAHPMVNLYALEGIRLIAQSLERAFKDGNDADARADLALGSLYGGRCLGPVNTAAIHALSYPLGGEYHIPHGVSNAMLLPHVMEKNLPEAFEHYARIGEVLGVSNSKSTEEKAKECIARIRGLCDRVGIPSDLSGFSVNKSDIPALSKSAYSVQRLLKNNLKELSEEDISDIYHKLF